MTIYLLNALPNALVVPNPGESRVITGIEERVASATMHLDGFVSAIGHESTANLLSLRLGIPISFRRITVSPEKGDVLMVAAFVTPRRLEEGELFTEEEILACKVKYCIVRI